VDAEFGNFRPGVGAGKAAAERARAMHAWMKHRGVEMRALHLDGPIRRMMACDRENKDGLDLEQAAEETADFLVECRKMFPETRVGLITNFPNWHYTPDHPGMLGTWSNRSGVHYRDALEAVYLAAKKKGARFDFVEVDCLWNYYRFTANRADPTRRVDNAAKFKALQRWCEQRVVEFWLVVNYDTNPQKVAGKPELVRSKVRRLVVMGGEFPNSRRPETNIATHIAPARVVADQWPSEIVWHGFEVGNVLITGARLKQTPKNNPVRRAYELRSHRGRPSIDGGQPSYDQAAALFAVRGATPEHWQVVSGGRVSVDEKGMTSWHASLSGQHAYVKLAGEPERLAREIEGLMIAPPKSAGMSPRSDARIFGHKKGPCEGR